jgi:hypothetical protein
MRQVWRDEHTAIYRCSDIGDFEVIVIKKERAKTIFGRSYPAREWYPFSEDWGTLAKTRSATDSLLDLKKLAYDLYQKVVSSRTCSGQGTSNRSGGIKVAVSSVRKTASDLLPLFNCSCKNLAGRTKQTNLETVPETHCHRNNTKLEHQLEHHT